MAGLPWTNWQRLIIWMVIGFVIYFALRLQRTASCASVTMSLAYRRMPGRRRRVRRRRQRQGGRWFGRRARASRSPCCCSVIAGGTAGYMVIEGWSAWDAFYMTVITVTTVGYREVHELSRAGAGLHRRRCCSAASARRSTPSRCWRRWSSKADCPSASAAPAPTYARDDQGSFHRLRLRPHRQHRRRASSGAQQRAVRRHRARSRSGCRRRSRTGALAVEADASREEVLKRVGIERARGLIAAVGTDAENVYTVLSARVLRPDSSSSAAPKPRTRRAS